ncbi:plant cysteine oxidase 2-like isoform X1 [Curcuma longa]|uniref:plant cysteine oxidase 2-like isoform X1 n=1 Tax=Curcuma longa TaxID=136217 RepID=UPI003D9F382F
MRVGGNLVADDHDGRVELAPENSKGPSKKGKRRQKKAGRAVQRLFETCKQVFSEGGPAGVIPSPEDVERLRSLLDTLKPSDVGLSLNLPYFQNSGIDGPPPVTYLHLYECPNFSIGIFCLPQAAAIPLHNHPSMTVFSKILLGSMHIKSYDWVTQGLNENIKSSSGAYLAKMNTDTVFTAPCRTSVLYPTSGGNLHCFTAVTSCAVLDVLGPPYNDDEGRTCTYYKEYAFSTFPGDATLLSGENEEYAWLEERGSKPDDLVVRGAEYRGPRILER